VKPYPSSENTSYAREEKYFCQQRKILLIDRLFLAVLNGR